MDTIGARLRARREKLGLVSAAEASRRFGWKQHTYRAHENASRGVPRKHLVTYAKAYKVSVSWLLTGREEQVSDVDSDIEMVPIVEWDDLPEHWGTGNMQRTALLRAQSAKIASRRRKGVSGVLLSIAVQDESMAGDGRTSLYPGDFVVVDTDARAKASKIALIYDPTSREHMLRIASFKNTTTIEFKARDPAFPAVTLPASSHYILGLVVSVVRNMA